MNIYIVSTDVFEYDEYDSVVVTAVNKTKARIVASEHLPKPAYKWEVEKIGATDLYKAGCTLHTSFNAG